MSLYIVVDGAGVFVILNILLIFLEIGPSEITLDYFACYLVT